MNIANVLEALKMKAGVAHVLRKYGRYPARIVQLLLQVKYLDEKTVGLVALPSDYCRECFVFSDWRTASYSRQGSAHLPFQALPTPSVEDAG